MTEARPLFSHLLDLTDGIGLFEHSRYAEPRREHGNAAILRLGEDVRAGGIAENGFR